VLQRHDSPLREKTAERYSYTIGWRTTKHSTTTQQHNNTPAQHNITAARQSTAQQSIAQHGPSQHMHDATRSSQEQTPKSGSQGVV
jgi:hypothetical protein